MKKKLLTTILAFVLVLLCFPTFTHAATFKITPKSVTLSQGQIRIISASGVVKSKIKWSSSNKSVATVTKTGRITAKAPGAATIKATYGKMTSTCKVTVQGQFKVNLKSYSGTFDKKAHTITVSNVPKGATVYYKTSTKAKWGTKKPSRTNIGTTQVYVKVTKAYYKTYTGSAKIVINDIAAPSAVTLNKKSASYNSIELRWDKPSNAKYVEMWRKVGSEDWAKHKTFSPSTTSFTDNDLQSNTDYSYRIRSVNTSADNSRTKASSYSGVALRTAAIEKDPHVVVKRVPANDCNFGFMKKSYYDWDDASVKNQDVSLDNFLIYYVDDNGQVAVPDGPVKVVIEDVDMDSFNTDEEIILTHTYIDPEINNGDKNGCQYDTAVPYEYDAVNHCVTFDFDGFMPYYGNILLAQGGHRQLIVEEEHGDLTWSVDNNLTEEDLNRGWIELSDDGVATCWGAFNNLVVTATDGERTWQWLINAKMNSVKDIDRLYSDEVFRVGETYAFHAHDDALLSYMSYRKGDPLVKVGSKRVHVEGGAIRDNGDGTFTCLQPGEYKFVISWLVYPQTEDDSDGYSYSQNATITMVE